MYWFLNEEANVDTSRFNTVEEYRAWLKQNPDKVATNRAGAHFRR
jgi:hypothetical protein